MDIPREIFEIICKHIIQRNSYGHTYKETIACVDISIENIRKARFVFDYMNAESLILRHVLKGITNHSRRVIGKV
jgi:hypothetical protein